MVVVQIGYAADPIGNGVAYARLLSATGERLVRVPFRVRRFAGLGEREVSFAALTAVASLLAERKITSAVFRIPDEDLVADRNDRRPLPPPLVLPYVRLGCALNRMVAHEVEYGADADLSARATAEVTLNHVA